MNQVSFLRETWIYAAQMRQFDRGDWTYYVLWVGLMLGLLFATSGFVLAGHYSGVHFPAYVWNVPIGTLIFIGAIAFDTIGHRTAYKEALKGGEDLVHSITIFAGITSCLVLCLAYSHRELFRFPAIALIGLSIFYSVIDEVLHWRRYIQLKSDRVEMWSHFFIFLGHLIMILSWYHWYDQGYPGVSATLTALRGE